MDAFTVAAGTTCGDDDIRVEILNKLQTSQSGIDLADAALTYHNVRRIEEGLELLHLLLHRHENTDFHCYF